MIWKRHSIGKGQSPGFSGSRPGDWRRARDGRGIYFTRRMTEADFWVVDLRQDAT